MGAFDDIIAQYGGPTAAAAHSLVLRGPSPPDPSQTYRGIQGLIREGSSSAADFFSKLAALPGKVMNDPGLNILPMPMGLVMRGPSAAANAAKLAEQIGTKLDALKSAGGEVTPFEYSKAYLSSKYPNLYNTASSITENPNLPLKAAAQTLTPSGAIEINPYWEGAGTPRESQIHALGHELLHSLQTQRPAQDLTAYRQSIDDFMGSIKNKMEQPSGLTDDDVKAIRSRNQQLKISAVPGFDSSSPGSIRAAYQETQAYPAGRTAQATYNTFQNMTTSPWSRAAGAVKGWLGF